MQTTIHHHDQVFRDQSTLIRLLDHLINAINDIGDIPSSAALEDNRIRFNSVAMEMAQVQECARKLSDSFRSTMPNLPWNELRALRNVIVHDYDEIDVESLYDTVTKDAPHLVAQLQPLVDAIED
ncbi:putative toxin-antitoxin system, antitoxin component [Bifidobacterium saguini DSM 23967]|uniref:DUF86 domain-containing protein n=2 Tax=Bifidobacterium saguini TaxID=762210 RepID=A0ABX7SGI7_9BIFI|nr:HepT-like ribonuclease domain-containing protein [Bifidobacterium saguini]KFI91673.1 putative toxin-antitoxin system, antitoxin component [Bifidobacterium saguini DSM 23967]QTB91895.1 DUF86 domain-containing protein [Bifidobacterium saguini]